MIHALAITGPTASGKTALSLAVARALGCEIISLDSMQIYRGMDIGTAKATESERRAAPHHCIDILSPDESFSAEAYRKVAMAAARDIVQRGKIPLFVGGTGLYLATLLRPEVTEFPPEANASYHESVASEIRTEEDKISLWRRLSEVDPDSAAAIHYNNVRRVIRALEIYEVTGKTKTYFDMLTKAKSTEISVCHVTLDFHERETLYERIGKRVDMMIAEGLEAEVRELTLGGYLSQKTTAAQAIGYKEMLEAIRGETSLTEAVERIKQASRNYAKRQLTWFRHREDVNTLFADSEGGDMKEPSDILAECLEIFENYLNNIKNT